MQLDNMDCYRVGVVGEFFSGYTEGRPVLSWFFEGESGSGCMVADGEQQGSNFKLEPFASGDIVTLELERTEQGQCSHSSGFYSRK